MKQPGRTLVAIFVGVLVGLPSAALAQAEPPAQTGPTTINLDFRDAELSDVIDTIAAMTNRNILYDDRVRGRVTLLSPKPVTVEEAYRVFEAILQVKGFTTVQGPGGILKVLPVREAKESAIQTSISPGGLPNRDLFITRLIPLRYVKADAMTTTLRPLVSNNANMVAYAPTNTIILTDTSANIRRLLTIIDQIDVKTYQEQIRVIPIKFADAETLAGQLREIFSEQNASPAARTRRAQPRPTRTRATPQAPGASVVGEVGEPRFITDARTNSIVAIAPGPTLAAIESLVQLLDYKRKGAGRIHVLRLQNADAEEMAQTLTSLAGGGRAPSPGAASAIAQAASAITELAEGVRITADAPTNSLIIQASAEGFAALRDVMEALDVRRPQVLVEALLMEVRVDDNQSLGSGLLYQSLLDDNDAARIVLGANTGGVTGFGGLADEVSTLGTFGDPVPNFVSAILGRTISVRQEDGSIIQLPVIQGIMVARGSDTDTNIISAPVILTADNEEAQIVVGENIPVITSRVQSAAGVTGATDLATSNSVERQDVGVTLRVTPQISEGDTVRLKIFQEISQVASEDPDLGPTTTKRTVDNTVYVQDGEAVMIGGIIADVQTKTLTKIPFLGDIPILGWAFKSTTDRIVKTNLLVVLTPHIVRTPEDLRRATIERREHFRSSAGEKLHLSKDEREARARAQAAGLDLPLDPNPVRRGIEVHSNRYPVEDLPELRKRQRELEKERLEEIERQKAVRGGNYLVQVGLFRTAQAAVQVLQELMSEGYDGTVLSRRSGEEVVHYVQLGPYLTDDDAQHTARRVRADKQLDTIVLVEP
jgi:general secretion pathway protein D